MTDTLQNRPHPEQLARRLTELEDQLRLSRVPASGALRPHPALGRLEAAARLLGTLEADDPQSGWRSLARAVVSFCATARAHPERLPDGWSPGVEKVTRGLERVLQALDEGTRPTRAARRVPAEAWPVGGEDPRVDELKRWRDRLAAWEESAQTAPVATLRERTELWREIRDRADRVFRTALAADAGPGAEVPLATAGVQVALLLASPFQREQLSGRLEGLDPCHLSSPAEVLAWLEQGPARAILLADNLEPSRHLDRTLGVLRERPRLRPERCLLVAGALASRRPPGGRALPAGVDGVWEPPYELADLAALVAPR